MALPAVRCWISAFKGGVLHFCCFGGVFMPAFGLGLVFWPCAVRLLIGELPVLHIQPKGEEA
jgi:hypothetical protein